MSNWDQIGFAPQGWQCPVCGAVYSPTTMQCFNCTGWKITNMTTGTGLIDMLTKETLRKLEEESANENNP